MGKVTLTVPEKLHNKLKKEAEKRKIPLNRLICQALMTSPTDVLEEVQFLRQELFVLRTKVENKDVRRNGASV